MAKLDGYTVVIVIEMMEYIFVDLVIVPIKI